MSQKSDYVLASPVEKDRLQRQALLWQPEAEALLDHIGVQSGWHCLDVGCGAMGILGPLSRRVGPNGRVVGIDADPDLLAAAQAFVKEEGLTNVELLLRDARNSGLPRESFDLTHIRFVLVFGHDQAILQEMRALTRPGGIMVAQETDQSSWNFYPDNPVWPQLKEVLEAAFQAIGGNANLGQLLLPKFRQMGLAEVQMRTASLALPQPDPYMQMPLIGANGFRPVILKTGLLTEAELDDLLANFEALINNPDTYATWFNLIQVWGIKPA